MGKVVCGCLLLAVFLSCDKAHAQKECSTEKVNSDCTITIDRNYPITPPTIQVHPGHMVVVVVKNPQVFESISLDPQTLQAVIGTDQTSGLVTGAVPYLKLVVGSTKSDLRASTELRGRAEMSGVNLIQPPPEITKVQDDLKHLDDLLTALDIKIQEFTGNATKVYLQLQEILSPLPRPVVTDTAAQTQVPVRDERLPATMPWGSNFPVWQKLLLCELGPVCAEDSPPPSFKNILGLASRFQATLPGAPPTPGSTPDITLWNDNAFQSAVTTTQSDIGALQPADREKYVNLLNELIARKANIATYNAAITGIAKDLSTYFFNISQVDVPTTIPAQLAVGEIHDPKRSKDPKDKNELNSKLLGLQVTFSVTAVNEVSTSVTSVPGPAAKKPIATITVLYADPIFEVSAGAFFSTLPNRSFANQTLVTQNPGASPTPGNVVIAETITRPTIVPFAGANFRLGPAFTWLGRRRGAFYLTGAVGANTYNSTAEFGVGPSVSWRAIMFSALYHIGHDTRLTQGEQVGEVWCNSTAATATVPKCSGSPPSPTSEKYWTGGFAFGISVRVPSVFSASGH